MILVPNPDRNLHRFLWTVVGAVFVWSFFGCHDRFTWIMEVFPVIIGTAILLAVYAQWRFTRLVACLLALHAVVLMVGGHYTYALVPVGDWVRDIFHLARNPYDRLGHFLQGFVPAMISREVLIRLGVVKRGGPPEGRGLPQGGGWLSFIVICICLAISAFYELIEWQAAVWTGEAANSFLGTQGDVWDTQWDMATALIGASIAVIFFSPWQDRQLESLNPGPRHD